MEPVNLKFRKSDDGREVKQDISRRKVVDRSFVRFGLAEALARR